MPQNQTIQELRKIEKVFIKLRNNLKRADLDYTVQVSINSTTPKHVVYACQMTAPANGLAPITFMADSADELVTKVKAATDKIDYKAVEVAWHKAQIQSCDRTKLGHEERIAEIEKEEEPNEDDTEEKPNGNE